MEFEQIECLGNDQICLGKDLILKLNDFKHIPGVKKIQRKISAEVGALKNAIDSKKLTQHNILCTNLAHFRYFVKVLSRTYCCQSVDHPVKLFGHKKASVRIDIVAENGREWIKVIARNPKALNDIASGRSNFGTKSILDHARDCVQIAKDNLQNFEEPTIVFDFANEIDKNLENLLTDLQIVVRINGKSEGIGDQLIKRNNSKLNLDVTALMAFVSALTCESCNFSFLQPILTNQARGERLCSTKSFLDNIFKGKQLLACESAINSFSSILNTVGGSREKLRAEKLLNTITILPDLTEVELTSLWSGRKLSFGKKIHKRTYDIFTFGAYHKAVTVTANKGAIKSAQSQGFSIPAIIHEARALTEQKQATAKKI